MNHSYKEFKQVKTYRNEELGFELQIPHEWVLETSAQIQREVGQDTAIVFKCGVGEGFNILIGFTGPELSLSQLEEEFRHFVQSKGYIALQFGRVLVHQQEQVWARFYLGDGVWHKKYLIRLACTEYAITASCLDQKILLQREQIWDAIVRSMRFFKTDDSALPGFLNFLSQPASLRDMPKRIVLCEQALEKVNHFG